MASNGDRLPYHPTSKPSKPSLFPWIKRNVYDYTLPVILFLCICSYFFGLWQVGNTATPPQSPKPSPRQPSISHANPPTKSKQHQSRYP
ncbi:hypothetical protein ACFX2J_041740 [Malus domestica]